MIVRGFRILLDQPEVGKVVWKDFLPAALASGQYQPGPTPDVVGHGLESLQAGIDRVRKGVSATKLIVTL